MAQVALTTARDLARRRSAWFAAVAVGLLFAGLLLGVGAVSGRVAARGETRSFTVAVTGDVDGARRLLDAVAADERLEVEEVPDPFQSVVDRGHLVGLELPDGVDEEMAAGRPVDLGASFRPAEALSTEAFTQLALRLQAYEASVLAERAAELGRDLPAQRVDVVVAEVEGDARIERIGLARQVAAVAALLGVGVVSAVAGVVGGARDRRSLEPLLLLPLRRSQLARGLALGAAPVAVAQMGAGVLLLVGAAGLPGTQLSQPPATVALMAVGGLLAIAVLGLLASTVGCLAGALGTGTDEAVGLGDLLAVPFVGVGVALFLVPDLAAGPLTCAVPVLGQALLVREAVVGELNVVCALAAVGSAALTAAGVLALAGRALGRERRLAGLAA